MKKKNEKQLRAYEKGWYFASAYPLFSAVSGTVQLRAIEENNPLFTKFNVEKTNFGSIVINNDTSCIFYLHKENKNIKEDWDFIFLVVLTILGLELYKKLDGSLEKELAIITFACSYIINNMKGDLIIPKKWEQIELFLKNHNFKNEDSVINYFKEDKKALLQLKNCNFLMNEITSIELTKENRDLSQKSFSEIFVDSLVSQARKTILLKNKIKLTDEEIKFQDSPIYKAKKWFIMNYPLLSSLAACFDVVYQIDICKRLDIQIGAVSAEHKVIYINPLANLNEMGMRFVIAHEILHIALQHSKRRKGRDHLMWNLACDFVINDWLTDMCVGVAPEGVYLDKSLKGKSADEIYSMIAMDVRLKKKMITFKNLKAGDGLSKNGKKNCDMLDDSSYFGDFQDACKEALLRGMFLHKDSGRGTLPSSLEEEIKVLNQPAIPWQVELVQWIAKHFPLDESKRTYSRASRRQSSTPDIIRPSYIKPTYLKHSRTFGVILDTSGSMDKELLGKCLGAISSYSLAQDVEEVRLIFCDAQPYDEGYVQISEIKNKINVKGRGGTVLQQAINYLENAKDFPDKAPILILTDGFFENNLTVSRSHAFLVPNRYNMPFSGSNIFEFK